MNGKGMSYLFYRPFVCYITGEPVMSVQQQIELFPDPIDNALVAFSNASDIETLDATYEVLVELGVTTYSLSWAPPDSIDSPRIDDWPLEKFYIARRRGMEAIEQIQAGMYSFD